MSLNRKQRRAAEAKSKKETASDKPISIQEELNAALQLHRIGKFAQAAAIYEKILSISPNHPDALHLLGVINYQSGDANTAIALIGKAIEVSPNISSYHNNLGNALTAAGKIDTSVQYYKKALELRPDYPEALNNIGAALHEVGRFEEEISYYKKGLTLNANNGHLLNELAKVLRDSCLWYDLESCMEKLVKLTESAIAQNKFVPFSPYHSLTADITSQLKKQIAQNYATYSLGHIKPTFEHKPNNNDKIRIGYLSADYRDHPTAHLINGLFKFHDRNKFEVYAYSFGKDDGSDYRKEIMDNSDHFVNLINAPTTDIADRIYSDKIDILIDVMGYIQNANPAVFALKPAPTQISYLAYPGTMGAKFIDYLITDHTAVPADNENNYSEKLLFMPDSYFVTDNTQKIAKAPSKKDCGLPEDKFVFCSFNKANKIDRNTFSCWMEILKEIQDSVLWLFSSNEFTINNLRNAAKKQDISPDRLIFVDRLPKDAHLARHACADLFLDCFTVNAHTTAIDALWANLPVITMAGDHIISRASASILNAAGLPELITDNIKSYKNLAVKYAKNQSALEKLKKKLAGNITSKPLFDTKKYVKNFEELLGSIKES